MAFLQGHSLFLYLIISFEVMGHVSNKLQREVTSKSKYRIEKDPPLHSQSVAGEQIKNIFLDGYGALSKHVSSIEDGSFSTTDHFQADNDKRQLLKSTMKTGKSSKILIEKTLNSQPKTTGGGKTPPKTALHDPSKIHHKNAPLTTQYKLRKKHNSREKEEVSITNHRNLIKLHTAIGPEALFVSTEHRGSFKCGKCLCSYDNHDFVRANCTYRTLTKFPTHLPTKTLHLNASRNDLRTLNLSSIIQLQNLKTLAIRSNKIEQIVVDASEISHLQTLDLGINQKEKLEDGTFSFFPHLRNLSLQYNKLKHIGNKTLFNLNQLRFLDLSANPTVSFDSAAFNTLTDLRELSLYRNKFLGYRTKRFPPQLFDKVKKLNILSIQGNSKGQTFYPIDALARITSLQKLNIDIVKNPDFLGPKMLELTQLTSLEFGPYSACQHIHTLHAAFFKYVPYIQSLSFNGCNFVNIQYDTYSLLPNLKALSIINLITYNFSTACNDLQFLQNSSLRSLRLAHLRNLLQNEKLPCISLKGIHCKYMTHLPLVELDLSKNKIALVQDDFIQGLPKTLKKWVMAYNLFTVHGQLWGRMRSLDNLIELDVSRQNDGRGHKLRETILLQTIANSQEEDMESKSQGKDNTSLSCEFVTTNKNEIDFFNPKPASLYYDYGFEKNTVNVNYKSEVKNDCQRLMDTKFKLPERLKYVKADHYNFFGDLIFSAHISPNNLTQLLFSNSHLTKWGDGRIPLHVRYLDLSQNYCRHLSRSFFRRNNSLVYISLSSNTLGPDFSTLLGGHFFTYLNHTKYLDISLNLIYYLPCSFLRGLVSLETLRMTDNQLQILNISFSETPSLRMLDVRRNSISWISKQTRKDLDYLAFSHPVTLALEHNHLPCTCGGIEIIKWLATTNVYLLDKELLQCYDEHDTVRFIGDIPLLYTTLQRQCTEKVRIIISCTLSVSFFVVIVVGYYVGKRYRWWFYVKYKKNVWFAKWFGFKPKSVIQPATEYRYDAYICYSEEDRYLAIEFANKLNGRQLFIPDRDILYGMSEVSGMTSGIINSHKFLILLTENLKEDLRTYFKHNGMLEYTINMALFEEHTMKRKFLHVVHFTNTDQIQMPLYLAHVLQDHDRQTTFPTDDSYASVEAIQCVWRSLSCYIAQNETRINDRIELPLLSTYSTEDNTFD